MKISKLLYACPVLIFSACQQPQTENKPAVTDTITMTANETFNWQADRFAEFRVLRYQIPGFESLSLKQKKLVYYLSQAGLCGRDILFDQNHKYNLLLRRTLEALYQNFNGDKSSEDFKGFEIYLKEIWFANGIHHHYSTDKFKPHFPQQFFEEQLAQIEESKLPASKDEIADKLIPLIFDETLDAKRVNLAKGTDLIKGSANNLYEGVSQKEAEAFYAKMKDPNDPRPIEFGLNSKLVKENGEIKEQVYKFGGMYSDAIEKIIYWLEKAEPVAENEAQKKVITTLIDYYKTGDLHTFDAYSVAWVQDTASLTDFVNGFIEVYGDALGRKATWESVVNFKDTEATKRTEIISKNAQWFEDNSPVDPRFKKETVKGVTAKVITAVNLGGDCFPATPIGINLPNSAWIRKEHGSKSVTIENITYAYDQASQGSGFMEEFAYNDDEIKRAKEYGFIGDNLHTDLHECLGHGSGQILPGVHEDALGAYYSTIEEARADLFALYYLMDKKMVEIGLIPSLEVAKAEYDKYIRNGMMTQLKRIELGKDIEESHMRNRQLIAQWVYEKGRNENIIERKSKDGKTFFVINNYEALRRLFGQLLADIQKMKSEGNSKAAEELVEKYAVKVDYELHKEVIERFEKLDLPSYSGFINPILKPIEDNGVITDILVEYPDNYPEQMLYYSKNYSYLPNYN